MKLLKLVSIPTLVWENGQPTKKTTQSTIFINPKYIISIQPHKTSLGDGALIVVQGSMTSSYSDERSPEEVIIEISKLSHIGGK